MGLVWRTRHRRRGQCWGQRSRQRQGQGQRDQVQGDSARRSPAKGAGTGAGADANKPAGPSGKALARPEQTRAAQKAPIDKDGETICRDASCHVNCKLGDECPRSHTAISSYKGLDWTVIASLYRRGGLISASPNPPAQINGRVEQLRAQAKQ